MRESCVSGEKFPMTSVRKSCGVFDPLLPHKKWPQAHAWGHFLSCGEEGPNSTAARRRQAISPVGCCFVSGCGTQRLLRPLSGPCILLATAPTASPCIPSFVAMRHLPPAGGSLWPQAAVVAVAISAENYFYNLQLRNDCGRFGAAFSREGSLPENAFFRCTTAASRQQQDTVCRCGLSCEKANWKNPQIFPICNH